MSTIIMWAAALLSMIYGALTAVAGFGQTRAEKIQPWAAWGLVLCGAIVIAAAILILGRSSAALPALVIGLAAIHGLAINNGYKMFGKINPSHHLARLGISILLILLAYIGLK